jgi:Fe-S-cluster containining protein
MENNRTTNETFNEQHKEEISDLVDEIVPFLLKFKREKGPEPTYLYLRKTVDNIKEKSGIDSKTSCTGKCSFCCHSNILVSHDEGIYIRTVVKQKGIIPNQERIKKQKSSRDIHFKDISWQDKACSLLSDPDENGDRQCTIYEDRPIICRVHNSTEDPIVCDRSEDDEKPVAELRVIALDAMMSASIISGGKPNSREPKLYSLHEFL